jgi:HEAT repeat protein
MSQGMAGAQLKYPDLRYLSPGAQTSARWFQQLARGMRVCRLYPRDNPTVIQIQEQLLEQLNKALDEHGAWRLRVTPTEIWLIDEPIVHPPAATEELDPLSAKADRLPFIFYRDGVRGLVFQPQVPHSDFDAFFQAMVSADRGPMLHDDLVTLLWQAHPVHIQIDAVPISQTIYLSSKKIAPGGQRRLHGMAFNWSPSGDEIHADLGQVVGAAQGLHRDTFDDWPLPKTYVDVPAAFAVLTKGMQFVRSVLLTEWSAERGIEWTVEIPILFRRVLEIDPSREARAALSQSLVTWLAAAVQRFSWDEAQRALALLREFDPDGSLADEPLADAFAAIDGEAIADHLDESELDEQSKFLAIAVALGRPALDLGTTVMAKAARARTRAAACTMLCYLCSDDPELLSPYLADERWYVVRNAVFVLGQIGGKEVVELLRFASAHPDARVRRQVVVSLANVPVEERLPLLASQLSSSDKRLLATTLNVMARHKSPETLRAILRQVRAPNFEARGDAQQRLIFNALAEMGDDSVVPTLAELLEKGGWFARVTPQRQAAAQALYKIGTEKALAVLEQGLRSSHEAVRQVCLEAMASKSAA